jgi:nucleoside-diphosphate-sugar epimerase
LTEGEERLKAWAESKGMQWVILRPTLIYGYGRDKNISEIIQFIHRFGFFPLLGKAKGLRQPIHADDVAKACVAVLKSPAVVNRAYNISGEETIPYSEMVNRVFSVLDRSPRLLTIPFTVFSLAVTCIRLLPRYRHWSVAMAERMNSDLVFDHSDAERDFGFSPRPFQLSLEDLPR